MMIDATVGGATLDLRTVIYEDDGSPTVAWRALLNPAGQVPCGFGPPILAEQDDVWIGAWTPVQSGIGAVYVHGPISEAASFSHTIPFGVAGEEWHVSHDILAVGALNGRTFGIFDATTQTTVTLTDDAGFGIGMKPRVSGDAVILPPPRSRAGEADPRRGSGPAPPATCRSCSRRPTPSST